MPRFAGSRLVDRMQDRNDNFLLLRIAAAVLVVFGHSYAVAGLGTHDFLAHAAWAPGMYTGALAVDVFFVASGFLVAGSYLNRQDLVLFVRARVLRIVPAFAACVLISALLIGPLVSSLSPRDYFGHGETWRYVLKNLSFIRAYFHLPGVFEENPMPLVVNGSLWTLPIEVRMYVMLALLGLIGMLRRRWAFNLVILAGLAAALAFPQQATETLRMGGYSRLAALFLLGIFMQINKERVPVSVALALLLCAVAYLSHGTPYFMLLLLPAIAYSAIWLAYAPTLSIYNQFGDYSYGVYLWGFPVQQLVVSAMGAPSPMQVFAWALPITLVIAVASWHWIEKPALRWKHSLTAPLPVP